MRKKVREREILQKLQILTEVDRIRIHIPCILIQTRKAPDQDQIHETQNPGPNTKNTNSFKKSDPTP